MTTPTATVRVDIQPCKNVCDYLPDYFGSTDGASDFFGLIEIGAQWRQKFKLSPSQLEAANKVESVAGLAGGALVFPDVVSDCRDFKKSIVSLLSLKNEDGKPIDSGYAVKKFAYKGLSLAGDSAKAVIYLDTAGLLELGGRGSFAANGIYNGSSLITDSIAIADKSYQMIENNQIIRESKSENEKTYYSLKNNLNCFKIAQKVVSIALAVIGLIALVFSISLGGPLSFVVLGLSTAYLLLHISNYFYGQVLKDKFVFS